MAKTDNISFLEKIEPGLLCFDEEMLITSANRIFLSQFPMFNADEIIGKNILEIHREESRNKITTLIQNLQKSQRQIVAHIKVDATLNFERYYLIRLMNLITGKQSKNYCLVSYDITDAISNKHHNLLKMPAYIGNEIYFIDLDEIQYFEADNVYTKFCTSDASYYAFLMISEIDEKLPKDQFIRVHRSYIVNMHAIKKITKKGSSHVATLNGCDAEIPIGRSRAKEFFKILGLK